MFVAFTEQDLKQAIVDKDYQRLKVFLSSTLAIDPLFKTNQVESLLKILHANIPEIFDSAETTLGYEYRLPKDQWDEEYYHKLTYWMEDNFVESRLKHIREVGKYVYGQKDSQHQEHTDHRKEEYRSSQNDSSARPTQAPERKKIYTLVALGILAIGIVLVLAAIVLCKRTIQQ